MNVKEVVTYGDLLEVLQTLSPEQLAQQAQIVKQNPVYEKVLAAHPIICVGSVDELGLLYVRSAKDNRRHGDEVILFVDGNPFSRVGAIGWELDGDDIDGKAKPVFPPNRTLDQDWTGPAQERVDKSIKELPDGTTVPILTHRMKNIS